MPAMPAAELTALFQARELLLGRGLAVLATWALLNLIGGGYLLRHADRRFQPFFFHGMNVGWGLVNAVLAFWGIWQLHPKAPAGLALADLFQGQLQQENLFLLNAGLDAAYIMTGFYLRALGALPGPKAARLLGFGQSLWVQGGFLMVFDAAMWSLLHSQAKYILAYL